MNLRSYEGENVRVVCIDGDVIEGNVGDYIFADDNEPEIESIIIDAFRNSKFYGWPIEILATEIKSIELI